MIIDHKIYFVILSIIVVSVFTFRCPENQGCNCQPNPNDGYQMQCSPMNNSIFNMIIQPGKHIRLECINSTKLSDFTFNKESFDKFEVQSMYFHLCDLPSSTTLSDITRIVGATDVQRLVFQSFGNLNCTLDKHHLQGFENLKYLILSSNNIFCLPEDLLADLSKLTGLNLRNNNIRLTNGFFNYTPELTWIELGDNNMKSIEPSTFSNLKKLTLLNLWKNHLIELQLGVFDGLSALTSLDLNSNNMASLPEDIFVKLENLEILNLSRNNFTQLPERLLQNNTKLHTVSLYDNKVNMTTLPEGFFANLTELKVLKLKRNGFITLPENLFWGAVLLTNISLEFNYIKSLPVNIFRDLKKLTILQLNVNKLERLPDYIFSTNSQLKKLDLSRNRITSISRHLFNGLYLLEELNMEKNNLMTISDQSFSSLTHLKIAKFCHNNLTLKSTLFEYEDEYGQKSPFHNCILLEELYLNNNNIPVIFSDWILSSSKIRKLDLKYNNITFISSEDLQFVSHNIKVDLTHNRIQHIFLSNAEQLASYQKIARDVIILVEYNPLICDCDIYDFLRYIEGKMHPDVQNYFHIIPGNLTCQGPEPLKNVIVTQLKSKTLTCLANNPDFETMCPKKCNCFLRPEDKTFIVDCSNKGLTYMSHDIKKPNNMWKLELNFSDNMLTQMPHLKELGLESAKKLILSHNDISEISLDGLSTTMQILELDNNNISRIDSNVLEFLKNSTTLTQLTLHANPWICDCNAKDFLNFIQTKFANIYDLPQVTCNGKNSSISKMIATDFCPVETVMVIGISVAIAFLGIFIGAFGLYYRYQRQIKVWLFAHQCCLWFVTEEELDKNKLYDAFISYSHKDEDFVINELVPKLESGSRPFKLCLHFRDWLAGEWIPTQIARSVEESRRTIVVLSPNFLESIWGRMEFRAAHSQALSEGRARVILILYGDIGSTNNLDPELKAYMSMNTYVKWGDPWFWNKLRYALPHPPKFMKNMTRKKIFENHQLHIHVNTDEKEFIFPVKVSECTPTVTTSPTDTLKMFICDKKLKEQLTSNDLQESCKLNGNIEPIFKPEQLVKSDSIMNKLESTRV